MGPRKPPKVKKNKKEVIEIDWADDEHFDEDLAMLYIEYDAMCYIFQEQVDFFLGKLTARFPNLKFLPMLNKKALLGEAGPRSGSFEISIAQNARASAKNLWSGIDKGPPRREKFSNNYDECWPTVQKILTVQLIPKEVPEVLIPEEVTEGGD